MRSQTKYRKMSTKLSCHEIIFLCVCVCVCANNPRRREKWTETETKLQTSHEITANWCCSTGTDVWRVLAQLPNHWSVREDIGIHDNSRCGVSKIIDIYSYDHVVMHVPLEHNYSECRHSIDRYSDVSKKMKWNLQLNEIEKQRINNRCRALNLNFQQNFPPEVGARRMIGTELNECVGGVLVDGILCFVPSIHLLPLYAFIRSFIHNNCLPFEIPRLGMRRFSRLSCSPSFWPMAARDSDAPWT